jgi:rubrerythrin
MPGYRPPNSARQRDVMDLLKVKRVGGAMDASCPKCGWEAKVSRKPEKCPNCGNENITASD